MEVVIRPIEHGTYIPMTVDAISCTYNMDGFTPMNAILAAYGLDREHFRKCGRMHEGPKLRIICHGDCYERPQVITVSKTERWDSEPGRDGVSKGECSRRAAAELDAEDARRTEAERAAQTSGGMTAKVARVLRTAKRPCAAGRAVVRRVRAQVGR